MSTTQATLSRVSDQVREPEYTVRIILSSAVEPWEPTASAWIDYSSMLYQYGDYSSLSDAGAAADKIIDRGSPAVTDSPHPRIDKLVWCYGETLDAALHDAHRVRSDDRVDLGQVVVPGLSSLGSESSEIADGLEALAGLGCTISVAGDGDRLDFEPGSSELREVIRGYRAADRSGIQLQRAAKASDVQRWADWDKDGGRAGLGFEWVDNELVPADNYDEVCAVLEMVISDDSGMTKSKAAAHLDTSPRTITRCIEERPNRYGLHIV